MPRTARAAVGGLCYHVLNRGNGRQAVFHKDGDYAAFFVRDAYHATAKATIQPTSTPASTPCVRPNPSPAWTGSKVGELPSRKTAR